MPGNAERRRRFALRIWGNAAGVGAHVIVKKESIALEPPVDFFGRAEAVLEAKLDRVALSGRTVPAVCLLLIAVWVVLR